MPPIIAIIGQSESGKTTLIEKLVAELSARGYRVATIKHAREAIIDQPGKDSWRHIQAGSVATVLSAPEQIVMVRPLAAEASLEQAARLLGEDADIILAEGFKQSAVPKIEVHRPGQPLLSEISRLVAVITDEPVDTRARQLRPDDVRGIADLLEEGFIKPQAARLTFYVNGTAIPLSQFPREFVGNVLLAMAGSLKGVGPIETLEIFLRRRDKTD